MIESPLSSEPVRDATGTGLPGRAWRTARSRLGVTHRDLAPDGAPRLGERAARVLAAEWIRHPAPRSGLVLDADAGSAVLDVLLADAGASDTITVVARPGAADGLRARFAASGAGQPGEPGSGSTDRAGEQAAGSTDRAGEQPAGGVSEPGERAAGSAGGLGGSPDLPRVRVVLSLAEADPAGIVLVAEPLTGGADEARAALGAAAGQTAPGGVLSVAGVAGPQATDGAAVELDRQAAFYGVGTDLVLRNRPPVRVHRLRYTPADPAVAERLLPAHRSSSVPLTSGMHLDSNGVAAAGALLGLAAAARLSRPRGSRAVWLVPALAALPVAAFFRDPERTPPDDPQAIVAASDGTVLSVERLEDRRFGPQHSWLRIATFLSVFNAHVNRSPVAGRVADFWVETGGFAAAMKPAAEHNVSAYTVLDTARGRVVVVQRTGLVARRIVQRAPSGAMLARGERFGLIRFGSRTDVYLPADAAEPLVGPDDRIRAGSTAIARWH